MPRRKQAHYGTNFDAQIRRAIQSGATIPATALKLDLSPWFVLQRGHALGLTKLIYDNGRAARARAGFGGAHAARRWRALAAEIGKAPGDQLVSDVARCLRDRPAELSDTAVAALHERGLTVDELCDGTRRPPWMIVRAVREAARCA